MRLKRSNPKRHILSAKSVISSKFLVLNFSPKFLIKLINFRHPERDVVLEHVKSHYRDVNAQEPSQAPSDLSAPPTPVVQMPFAINAAINNLLSVNDQPSQASSTALNLSNSNSRLNPIVFDQHNGMDGVSPTKGCFKCGHCGQISNWKHVIQVIY